MEFFLTYVNLMNFSKELEEKLLIKHLKKLVYIYSKKRNSKIESGKKQTSN